MPILAVLEWWAADGLLGQRSTWWRVLLILAAPYVVLGAVGVAVGLPWFRWPAIYYRSIFPKAANLAGDQHKIHLEVLFYLRYLLRFEPALGLGLGVAEPRVLAAGPAAGSGAVLAGVGGVPAARLGAAG